MKGQQEIKMAELSGATQQVPQEGVVQTVEDAFWEASVREAEERA